MKTGILIVCHGSQRREANEGFEAMVARIAAHLHAEEVLATYFSIVHPSIEDRVDELVARGVERIVLMPYFLFAGQHISVDIPVILNACRTKHPQISLEMLPSLENDPAVEGVVAERLKSIVSMKVRE
jgi:sirohydrochlorin cobaltochelatase